MGAWVILVVAMGQAGADETLREMDFAFGRLIQLGSDSPLYRFYLDEHVYRNVVDQRLVDLRVFNRQKETVPLRLKKVTQPVVKSLREQALPLFPLRAELDQTAKDIILNFKRNGEQTEFNLTHSDVGASTDGVTGFLMDLSEIKQSPERLMLDLEGLSGEYRLAAEVSVGDDLNEWKVLVPSAALVKMTFNGHQLVRNYIDLPAFSGRYLRLTFQTPFEGRLPISVTGFFPTVSSLQRTESTALKAKRSSDHPGIYTFDADGYFPVDRIQLRLPQPNRLVKARISSRADTTQSWRHRTTAIFYHLKIDGAALENVPVTIPATQDSLYRMEILAGGLPKDGPGPELLLFWHPHECAFVASGDAPYMLAYGNAGLIYEDQAVDDLLEAIGQKNERRYLGFSRLDLPQVLGGKDRLQPPVYSRGVLLRLVLWGVLILSVFGLAMMAHRLYRQMRA